MTVVALANFPVLKEDYRTPVRRPASLRQFMETDTSSRYRSSTRLWHDRPHAEVPVILASNQTRNLTRRLTFSRMGSWNSKFQMLIAFSIAFASASASA